MRSAKILLKMTEKEKALEILPNWFEGEVYDEGGTVENPFSGEQWSLNAGELSMYDLIMGINYVGDHRGWDDEMIELHQKALSWFRTVNPKAYMVLLD